MRLLTNILTASIVLIFISCSTQQDSTNEDEGKIRFVKYLEVNKLLSFDTAKNNRSYLFIPIKGNERCVQKSIEFLKAHPTQNQYIIMRSSIHSCRRRYLPFQAF
jgi:dimeric dUTPase (all-alpha-NTP-PPase superfamily)